MKRTKQAYFRPNPTHSQTQDISGVTFVFGQDNNYHERTKDYQKQQKQFLQQQIRQKQELKQQQNQQNLHQDNQLLQVNRLRGQLEMEKHDRLNNMERAVDDYNLQQAEERKLREKQQRDQELEQEKREIELLNQRNVKRYIPGRKN